MARLLRVKAFIDFPFCVGHSFASFISWVEVPGEGSRSSAALSSRVTMTRVDCSDKLRHARVSRLHEELRLAGQRFVMASDEELKAHRHGAETCAEGLDIAGRMMRYTTAVNEIYPVVGIPNMLCFWSWLETFRREVPPLASHLTRCHSILISVPSGLRNCSVMRSPSTISLRSSRVRTLPTQFGKVAPSTRFPLNSPFSSTV